MLFKDKKISVAFWSIVAAVFLTSIKLIVGVATNSLGILAEALHSALDFVAAVITFFAVYISNKPPDKDHHFGHGKIENFSALIETGILLITCGWIILEALERFNHPVNVEINIFSFLVIIVAIIVDYERSKALLKVAKETNSQALEADALHFSTDILSSIVVLLGLVFVAINFPIADVIAGLIVAIIIIWISVQLGKKTIRSLLDHEPKNERILITNFLQKEFSDLELKRLRLRESGPQIQGDLIIAVPNSYSIIESHIVANNIEHKIKQIIDNIDILIYVTPKNESELSQDTYNQYYTILKSTTVPGIQLMEIHDIIIYKFTEKIFADLHILLESKLLLKRAHEVTETYEKLVKSKLPEIESIHIHIEPFEDQQRKFGKSDDYEVRAIFHKICNRYIIIKKIKDFSVISNKNQIIIQSTIIMDSKIDLNTAHRITELVESDLLKEIPNIQRITIHTEPEL
ncbi:MAG: Ferrous-iron efflux pump FieF [Candidatus Heimdallarchaeota archaeon LC_3]|nr:MAG: Ferrous-iron efflux pump FieF [Candidatus Heimdallarchaeota archaeon LC_3]